MHLKEAYQEVYLTIEAEEIERFKTFFERGKAIKNIFTLQANKVTYSNQLTAEDIQEILVYIDKQYKVLRRRRNLKYWI